MPDREKVIKAWEIFRDSNPYEICSGHEFRAIREPEYCMGQMIEDTIALLKEQQEQIDRLLEENASNEEMAEGLKELLKEQEAVKPKSKVRHGETCQYQHWCGNCMVMLHGKPKFCPNCGRKVKWK